jgi:metallo-beta-lactamase family protein
MPNCWSRIQTARPASITCFASRPTTIRPSTTHALRRSHLAQEVRDAASGRGALLIPAFAVERTQELIVDLTDLMARGEIPTAPIFLDSPLAIRAREVFRNNAASLDPAVDLDRLLTSNQLHFTETVDESKSIARLSGFHIIIAASGMCDAGRIRHHLKRWLWRREGTVLLAGFQAQGTLGRFLRDGAKAVRIQGEEIRVAARIRYIDEYSGHADGPELARWIAARRPIHRGLFIVHGEEHALGGLLNRIAERTVPTAQIFTPMLDDVYDLLPHRRRSTSLAAAGSLPMRSSTLIGTTICPNFFSISMTRWRPPRTIDHAASSSGNCAKRLKRYERRSLMLV